MSPGRAFAAPEDAIASASYGSAEIWLQRKAGDQERRELVFRRRPGAPARVLKVAVGRPNSPSTSGDSLALGLDRSGRLTAVLECRLGLCWTHVTGRPRLRLVPGTTTRDDLPALFRGRLAYARQMLVRGDTTAERSRASVRTAPLTGGTTRTVWRASDGNSTPDEVAIGAGEAIAFVLVADGAEEALFDALLARPGRTRTLDLWPGDKHNGGLRLVVSRGGSRLTVASSRSSIRYALPSGRRLGRSGSR